VRLRDLAQVESQPSAVRERSVPSVQRVVQPEQRAPLAGDGNHQTLAVGVHVVSRNWSLWQHRDTLTSQPDESLHLRRAPRTAADTFALSQHNAPNFRSSVLLDSIQRPRAEVGGYVHAVTAGWQTHLCQPAVFANIPRQGRLFWGSARSVAGISRGT